MSHVLLWALVTCALLIVVVRRRTAAVPLVALQSLLLGAQAIGDASQRSNALLVAGVILVVKAVVLPVLLMLVVRRTREATPILSERHPLARLIVPVACASAVVLLMPRFGLRSAADEHAAVALVVLGIATAIVRRPALFQAIGFLVAENGLYLAGLGARGGLPTVIELGLVFDLIVIVTVAGVFSAKIHEQFGTGDTSLLGGLRD